MTLAEVFKNNEESLREKLSGLSLPKDTTKIEDIVSNFLNTIFESNGEYRQNLTQSEDYILQAALSLLHAQQKITLNITRTVQEAKSKEVELSISKETNIPKRGIEQDKIITKTINSGKVEPGNALLSSTGGALVGNLIFGGWGAVFGTLAGTALAIYTASIQSPSKIKTMSPVSSDKQLPQVKREPQIALNVNKFTSIISQICESVDNLIDTFRAQIKKVVNKYESQEKPTLDRNFPGLLESIQSLIGFTRYHNSGDEKYEKKIKSRLDDILDQLDTQGIEVVDYTTEKSYMFEQIPSDKASEVKLVFPAFVKNGTVIVKGQVFIPQ